MSQWDYLFQDDDDTLTSAEAMDRAVPMHEPDLASTRHKARSMEDRVAQLELTVEALIRLLGHRGVRREELAIMIQRIDLLDGVEDGQIGPDKSRGAPQCKQCKRPVNPNRDACLFCDAPIRGVARTSQRPVPTVACSSCADVVPQNTTYFSEIGVVCESCYNSV